MQIKDVTKRRDDEVVIHYIDDDGVYQSLRAYPSDIIAWHKAAQQSVQRTADDDPQPGSLDYWASVTSKNSGDDRRR